MIDQPIGWLLYNEGTVYLGLVYVYTLFMTLPIFLSIEKIDPRLIEAASDLGARPLWIFLRIILPLSWPGVLSGSIMVFLLSMSAYVTPPASGGLRVMFSNMIAAQFLSNNNWAQGQRFRWCCRHWFCCCLREQAGGLVSNRYLWGGRS